MCIIYSKKLDVRKDFLFFYTFFFRVPLCNKNVFVKKLFGSYQETRKKQDIVFSFRMFIFLCISGHPAIYIYLIFSSIFYPFTLSVQKIYRCFGFCFFHFFVILLKFILTSMTWMTSIFNIFEWISHFT